MKSIVNLENISIAYTSFDAISDITLRINENDFACIVGPNGAGKTTLLKTILGLLKQNSGTVELLVKKNKIGYMPQATNIDRDFPITIKEAVMTAFLKKGLNPFRKLSCEEHEKALYYLDLVGLSSFAENNISQLSGGEFQRLLLARAIACEPDILFLDEPTANIDAVSRDKIFSLLKELHSKGKTIVIVTHDLEFATNFATKLICINRTLIYCGEPPKNKDVSRLLYGDISIIKEQDNA